MKRKAKHVKFKNLSASEKIRKLHGVVRHQTEDIQNAYRERDKMVAFISKLFPSYRGLHDMADGKWDKQWVNIIYVDTPEGQLSWHIHEDELPMFAHLELRVGNNWDGHTTEEKYERMRKLTIDSIFESVEEQAKDFTKNNQS